MMWKRFQIKIFEAFVGVFVICNGLLTIFPIGEGGSSVRDSLWNIMGFPGIAIPIAQIVAGLMKVVGIAIARANIEAAGLVIVSFMFLIRAIGLVADGDVTNSDINNLVIAFGIIFCNTVRLIQLSDNKKYYITEAEIKFQQDNQ